MAAGQQLLRMIRNGDFSSGNMPSEIAPAAIEVETDVTQSYAWENQTGGGDGSQIIISGTGDDLLFSEGTIEWTAPDDQGAPYNVRAFRILGNTGKIVFPETSFTPIEVEGGSTLRFTEIKLTLTD